MLPRGRLRIVRVQRVILGQQAGAEVYPSLGGWSLSDPFPEMAADVGTRRNFVEKCAELIEDYGFDGLDLDWEYPGYEDHSGTPADTENYNLLLRDLRQKLDELGARTGKFYGLTAALPCGTANIANIDIPAVAHYLTEFNLMTYDFFGAWSPTTGANAPLYDQAWGDDDVKDYSVDGCVRKWIQGGANRNAINIGLPFYGRSFIGAKGLNEPHQGNDKSTWWADDGSPQYFNIVEKLPGLVSVRHEPTKTQYAYKNTTMGGLVSYDDSQAICDKTEYCLDHHLNGFIIWELSGDLMQDLSTPLLDAVHSKLVDPALDCKTLEYSAPPIALESQNVQPVAAPITQAPTVPLYCPQDATGPRQYNGCSGYYYCVYGEPRYPAILCPPGTLFDENWMLCYHAELVTCSESRTPSGVPTARPTDPPATAPPSLRPSSPAAITFHLIGNNPAPEADLEATTVTEQEILADEASSTPVSATSSNSGEAVAAHYSNDATSSAASCPIGYTGVLPWNDCREYFYCINSVPHLPPVHCEKGTLFDVESNACLDASQVNCFFNASGDADPPKMRPAAPKPLPTRRPSKQPTQVLEAPSTNDVTLQLTPEPPSPLVPSKPTPSETHVEPSLEQAQDSYDGGPTEPSHAVDVSDSSNPSNSGIPYQPVSLDASSSSSPGSPIATSYTSSSSGYSSGYSSSGSSSHWSAGGTSNSFGSGVLGSMEQGVDLDTPFITIELLLNDSPEDIGWQLLSTSGQVNVAKLTGAYSLMQPNAVVREVISLHTWLSDEPAGIIELHWTIMNVRGKGLEGGGYFKLYAYSPGDGKLLATGNDFGYMDTVGLAVTGTGLISLLDDMRESDVHSTLNSSQNQGAHQALSPLQDDLDHGLETSRPLDAERYREAQSTTSQDAILIPVLVSLAVVAVVTGLLLLLIAFRRKASPRATADYHDGESTNFDGEIFNAEGGARPEEYFFDDYCHDTRADSVYDAGNSSNIGSLDGFDGYEAKPNLLPGRAATPDILEGREGPSIPSDFSDVTSPVELEGGNRSDSNIDDLLRATRSDLERSFDTDIYSILENLERDVS